jgi:hypothetical protein
MKSRLFHTIVVCGASLGLLPLGCAADVGAGAEGGDAHDDGSDGGGGDAGAPGSGVTDRCRLPEGGCREHCAPLGDGGCLDPCFVHTASCSPDCLQLDGSCGWPPTK